MDSYMRMIPPPALFFKGRDGDPRLGEWVETRDSLDLPSDKRETIVLVGCPDDTGVTLNRGRSGAKEGPDSIRKHLYKMALPMDLDWEKSIRFIDFGNLLPEQNILTTHGRAQVISSAISSRGYTGIFLGGGHDFAAPNFLGFSSGRRTFNKKEKFSLINVDPHLDVRELEENRPHSGTPFRQILDSGFPGTSFLEFGARANRNSRAHYQYCRSKKVTIETLENIRAKKISAPLQFQKCLKAYSGRATTVAVTFDMDSCTSGEGVSAAPVIGFTAWELYQMAAFSGAQKKVSYFEIAEVAPNLDTNERTSRIAAEMIYAFLRARSELSLSRR